MKHWLEDLENEAVIHENVQLLPNVPNDEVRGRVDADSDDIPVDRPRFVYVEIRLGNAKGKVLFSRKYAFRQILPAEYLRVETGYNQITHEAFVIVRHLASDPVNGPVGLTVNIGGMSQTRPELDRGRGERWWRVYPQPPQSIPWQRLGRGGGRCVQGRDRDGPRTSGASGRPLRPLRSEDATSPTRPVRRSDVRAHDSPTARNGLNAGDGGSAGLEREDDGVEVVDAASPGAAADGLQGGPEPGVVGQVGVGRERRGAAIASAEDRGPSLGADFDRLRRRPGRPSPSSLMRSTTIRIRSPSRTLPIGPPARASGPTWPMQAPVETPEKRASVSTAICLPNERCLSAAVIW